MSLSIYMMETNFTYFIGSRYSTEYRIINFQNTYKKYILGK